MALFSSGYQILIIQVPKAMRTIDEAYWGSIALVLLEVSHRFFIDGHIDSTMDYVYEYNFWH